MAVVGQNESSKQMFQDMPSLKPKDIADAVLHVLSAPAHVQVHELLIKPVGQIS